MAFISEIEKDTTNIIEKRSMPEDKKIGLMEKEINSLVKARGFDEGRYRFIPNDTIIQRKEGSIINGKVVGSFTMEEYDTITLDRSSFGESTWGIICSKMGFKYHVHSDIEKFIISKNGISVHVGLVTPTNETK